MSRLLSDLHPDVKRRAELFIVRAAEAGIPLIVTQTFRNPSTQAMMYAKGRTAPGEPCRHKGVFLPVGTCSVHPLGLPVTKARPGYSFHEYRVAFDIAVVRGGKPTWDDKVSVNENTEADYLELGPIGEACGLEWGGRWPHDRIDMPHYQVSYGLTIVRWLKGERPEGWNG